MHQRSVLHIIDFSASCKTRRRTRRASRLAARERRRHGVHRSVISQQQRAARKNPADVRVVRVHAHLFLLEFAEIICFQWHMHVEAGWMKCTRSEKLEEVHPSHRSQPSASPHRRKEKDRKRMKPVSSQLVNDSRLRSWLQDGLNKCLYGQGE